MKSIVIDETLKEWKLTLTDKYYLNKVEELKKAGIPRCVGYPAMLKLYIEESMKIAYI